MRKFLYLLPAAVISLIYLFLLWITRADLGEILDMFSSMAGLYLLLPIVGSFLLLKGKWWGSLAGMLMGLMVIYQDLNDFTMQHIDIEIPLGIAFLVYYFLVGLLCLRDTRK